MQHTSTTYSNFSEDYTFGNCIMSLVRQYRGVNTCVSQIQLDATSTDVKIGCRICDTFTYENGLLYNDMTHYTQKGRNIVGKDLAQSFVSFFT